jgi:hypothetical protein
MMLPRTPDGKVVLWSVETGERLERYPIDARELLATGAFTTDQASAESAVSVDASSGQPAADPMPHVTRAKEAANAVSPVGAPLVVGAAVSDVKPVALPPASSARKRR